MEIRAITKKEENIFNQKVPHPLQTYEWGEFREKTGIKVMKRGFFEKDKLVKGYTLTIHKIPKTPFTIGYLPKGNLPDEELLNELKKIGKEEKCIFIQLEPNVICHSELVSESHNYKILKRVQHDMFQLGLAPAAHPLFTKYTFILDLTKSEDQLLKDMHPKSRYNIKVALKHEVEVVEDNSDTAFEKYLELMRETTQRQKFYAHSQKYHQLMWQILNTGDKKKFPSLLKRGQGRFLPASSLNKLTAHLLNAKYKGKTLATWILFVFKDTLYYPYGASSSEYKEVMASSLIMWEAIRFGKKLGLKNFDMWGALGPNSNSKDPWFGFHNFKQKFGARHVEFIGSYDLIINPVLYQVYKFADKLRWIYLKLKN